MIGSFAIMITYVILNNVYSSELPDQKLHLSTAGCMPNQTNSLPFAFEVKAQTDWKNVDDSFGIRFLSISYMWYSGMGCVLAVILGLISSQIVETTGYEPRKRIQQNCLCPPILRLLTKYFPQHLNKFVELSDSITSENKAVDNTGELNKKTSTSS